MAIFKVACMALLVMAITARNCSGEVVIKVWQDGANVRAQSDGGMLDYTALTYLGASTGNSNSLIQTNSNLIGIGGLEGNAAVGIAFYGVYGEITRTGTFGDGLVGGVFCDFATGPQLEVWEYGVMTTDTTVVDKIGMYGVMDSTFLNTTMSLMGFVDSPPTTTYTWGSGGTSETIRVLFGAPTPSGVPEIDPAGMGSVLGLVCGALGLLERRRVRVA